MDELTPTQRMYVIERTSGKTPAQAAREAGVTKAVVASWNQARIEAAIDERRAALANDPRLALMQMIPAAIAGLEKAVKAGNLRAIREVFDRTWGKPTQRQEISSGADGAIVVVSLGPGLADALLPRPERIDYRTGIDAVAPLEQAA